MSPSTAPHGTTSERREWRRLGSAPSWAAIVFTASLVAAVPLSLFAVETLGVAVVVLAVGGAMVCVVTVTRRLRTCVGVVRSPAERPIDIRTGD